MINITLDLKTVVLFMQLANAMDGQGGVDMLRTSTWNPATEESVWIVMEIDQVSIVNIARRIITSQKKKMNRAEYHV